MSCPSSSFISSSSSSSKSKSKSGFISSSGGRYDKNRSSADTSSFSSTTTYHRDTHLPCAASNTAIVIPKKSGSNLNLKLNLSGMVNKLMEKRCSSSSASKAAAKGRTEGGGGALVGLMHKKLFTNKKALTPINNNSRSLGMVLKSERELLSVNKEHEALIIQLNSILVQKNTEIDKLKDLCLKQREEIESLKTAILFPAHEDLSSMSLQRQVTTLTHQLHSLAQDLSQVKAEKYSVQRSYDEGNLTHHQEEATNSLEFSTTPGSPDDMFLNDLNPCLTPYAKSKSKEFEYIESHSPSYNRATRDHGVGFGSHGRNL